MISNPSTVVAIARSLRAGEITSVQLTAEYLSAIAQQNRDLNAFISVLNDVALEQATAADRRHQQGKALSLLDGVPIAVKDNIDYTAAAVTNGVGALRDRQAQSNAEVTRRLLAAGAVILGKLNMDEAALGATTNNPHFGACANPRVPGDTPGGSSGGSGAAVAAGLCAAALGSDTLGSVRIPAAYCGVTGLLGSRGQVSRSGLSHLSVSLDQIGVLAQCPADAALVYDVMRGYDQHDEQSWPSADRPLCSSDKDTFNIAIIDCAPFCDGTDAAEISAAVAEVADGLATRGHRISAPVQPAGDFTALRRAALLVIEAEGSVACADWLGGDGVSESLRGFLEYGARQPAQRIELARAQLRSARNAWRQLLQQYDFLLLPTAPQSSFAHGAAVPANQADFTTPASVAGLPAISLPCGRSASGRCLSIQLVGKVLAERDLLAVAAQVEEEYCID